MEKVIELVGLLNEIPEEFFDPPNKIDGRRYANDQCSDVEVLANEVLITNNGRPNLEAIKEMKKQGFRVVPGEKDSFGWITGVIIFPGNNNPKAFVFG